MSGEQFGKTLSLDADGDLVFNELNEFELVSGYDAVVQELKVLLATVQGEDPFDEEHGLDVFAATGNGEDRARLEISEALLRDDRVKSVDGVNFAEPSDEDDPRAIITSVSVTLIDGSQHTFKVTI